jgi:DNA modification methylase
VSGTEPYWSDGTVTLYLGDCREVLAEGEAASVDAVVTDPPYDLTAGKKGGTGEASLNLAQPAGRSRISTGGGFMDKDWDATGVAFDPATWRAVLRVLKPGGHLLAFGGTRTWHRLAVAIEDAGFEIRDSIHWIYGTGFPKSLDVSKAIDKLKRRDYVLAAVALGLEVPGNSLHDWTKAEHSPGDHWWEEFKRHLSPEQWSAVEREFLKSRRSGAAQVAYARDAAGEYAVTAPATDDAARWEGWGTALKPAHEPIMVARKPLAGTVAANVLEHGTGALNIAGCRVEHGAGVDLGAQQRQQHRHDGDENWRLRPGHEQPMYSAAGRWPPNVLLGPEAAAELDRQSGVLTSGVFEPHHADNGKAAGTYGSMAGRERSAATYGDSGGASRFFPVFRYVAKAGSAERPRGDDGTAHPTVKPVSLIAWLCRLVTPPGGLVLDPFAGSGTTAEACIVEGFRCVLIEKDPAYAELIRTRLRKPMQPVLFGGEAS